MIDYDGGARPNRILTRRQAERFVNRRNRMRLRSGYGILENNADALTLIFWIFIICLGLYGAAGRKKVGDMYIDEWDEAELDWQTNCAHNLILLAIGFLIIIILSHCM